MAPVERFERVERPRTRRAVGETSRTRIEALWRKAGEISGIPDRAELEETVLTRFIQREAALALIRLGGSDPNARAAPRERPWA